MKRRLQRGRKGPTAAQNRRPSSAQEGALCSCQPDKAVAAARASPGVTPPPALPPRLVRSQ